MPLTLTLTLERFQNAPIDRPDSRRTERAPLSIGRSSSNDWVLDDPDLVLSRRHCSVAYEDGHYYLYDHSSNGVFLNDSAAPIGRDQRARIDHQDRFTIGDYRLRVEVTDPLDSVIDAALSTAAEATPKTVADATPILDPAVSPARHEPATALSSVPEQPKMTRSEPDHYDPPDRGDEPVADASSAAPHATLRTLLRGAGVEHLSFDDADAEQRLLRLGEILRRLAEGLLKVTAAGGTSPQPIQQTLVEVTRQNPLRHLLTVDEMLYVLLGQRETQWMTPAAAITDLFDELTLRESASRDAVAAAAEALIKLGAISGHLTADDVLLLYQREFDAAHQALRDQNARADQRAADPASPAP